jgi:predicted DNA-binding transcriptional regulator AlpA
MAPPLSPDKFREEVNRRLVDLFDVMAITGLRSRAGIQGRVQAGQLPQPVYVKNGTITLWDRDEVVSHTQQKEK